MQTNEIKLYSLPYTEAKSYIATTLFVIGNILLPQLCHAIPQGGLILLPIYFFTLIAAYKYGWRVGLMTALLSPVVNHLLFGMPPIGVLHLILVKSVVLALAAGYVAHRVRRVTLHSFVVVVAIYQLVGSIVEWVLVGDLAVAFQDFRLGIPGMLVQIFGGYCFVKYICKR